MEPLQSYMAIVGISTQPWLWPILAFHVAAEMPRLMQSVGEGVAKQMGFTK